MTELFKKVDCPKSFDGNHVWQFDADCFECGAESMAGVPVGLDAIGIVTTTDGFSLIGHGPDKWCMLTVEEHLPMGAKYMLVRVEGDSTP